MNEKKKLKKYLLSKIKIKSGYTVVDLGCGDGQDLINLDKKHKDKNVKYIGVDKLDHFYKIASENVKSYKNIEIIQEDISKVLPFEDESVDVIYSHNLLECISDKKEHIREIDRVLKKGGQVIYSHADWDSQMVDGENKDLIRKVLTSYAEWKQPWMDDLDSWLGRRLWGLFNNTTFFEGEIDSFTMISTDFKPGEYGYDIIQSFSGMVDAGLISKKEFDEFTGGLQKREEEDKFFYSITNFIYKGVK